MPRRIDIGFALITAALAAVGIGFAVFGPATFSYGTNWLDSSSSTLWEHGLDAPVLLFLALIALAALGLILGAYLRAGGQRVEGVALLWLSTIVLFVAAAITLPGSTTAIVPAELHTDTADSVGIGIYVLPVAFVAFITALVGMGAQYTSNHPLPNRPH